MEKRNVPKLRFKGFEDEWKENKIGDIFRVFAGGDINKKNFSDIKNDEFKYPVYSNTLINEGIQGYSNIYRFNSETITVTGRGVNVGVAKARFCKYYPIVRLLSLIPTQEVNVKFFEEVINNTNIFIESTGVPQLTSPQIAKVKVSSPSFEEQGRIANFFTVLDKLIEEEEGKVRDLELYKKGMMQKIFKQEIRFKDDNGLDYPAWEEKKLGSLILYKSERNKEKQVSKVLSVSNKKGFIAQSDQFEDREVASSDTKNYKVVRKDDFAFNPSRINVGSIARLKNFDVGIISPMYVCFACIEKVLSSSYFEKFIDTFSFKIQVKNKLEGSVRQTLSFNALEGIKIQLPVIEEQIKIANFLSNIDNLKEEEQKNLDDLREMKKGLLQQMFV